MRDRRVSSAVVARSSAAPSQPSQPGLLDSKVPAQPEPRESGKVGRPPVQQWAVRNSEARGGCRLQSAMRAMGGAPKRTVAAPLPAANLEASLGSAGLETRGVPGQTQELFEGF